MIQVDDDPELLEQMIADNEQAQAQWHASARWKPYSERFISYLKSEGLHDFRRAGNLVRTSKFVPGSPAHVLASFGAVDLNPDPTVASPGDMFHAAATQFLGKGAVPITAMEDTRIGNPEGFEINGKFYTRTFLLYFCRYAYMSKHVRFGKQTVVEVGPGSGKQAALLKKVHPGLTIVLFDLPTQLYVCHQYLSKVFEGQGVIADYRQCREYKSFADIEAGKINILPNWKFPIVEGKTFDILINTASFQEMDPRSAKEYLRMASGAEHMYFVHTIVQGKKPQGERGVINKRNLEHHREVDRIVASFIPPYPYKNYFESFWTRKRRPLHLRALDLFGLAR